MNMEAIMAQVNDNIAKLSEEEQFLIANCVENILNGSHWGFMTKGLLKVYKEPLKYNNDLTSVTKVSVKDKGYTYLVEARNVKGALKVLQRVAPSLVDQKFIEQYINKANEAKQSFTTFMKKSAEGSGFKGYIGVNSINSTPTMTVGKDRHKAFQLPFSAVVTELSRSLGSNALVYIDGKTIPVSEVPSVWKDRTFLDKLTVSDGATSVVLPLVIRGKK